MATAGRRCSLKECIGKNHNAQILDTDSRVEVCTVVPDKQSISKSGAFLISWTRKGGAEFHRECWDAVIKSARARNVKNMKFKFSVPEKSMVKEAAKTAEFHDSEEILKSEGKRIASMMRSAKHCVVFTGAGISTSAGIGDYRGKNGKWTEDDRANVVIETLDSTNEQPAAKKMKKDPDVNDVETSLEAEDEEEDDPSGIPYESLRPTYTHEAIEYLMSQGLVQHVISQNCDGLHGLSGIPANQLSELHGNIFLEYCENCRHGYERPYYVLDDVGSQYWEEMSEYGRSDVRKPKHSSQCELCGLTHRTGRKCEQKGCKGHLKDTIINFRDHLGEDIQGGAERQATAADLMVCLGTTLMVTPASDLVEMAQEPLRVVICNRQKTALDDLCGREDSNKRPLGSRIFGDCDKLMSEVMKCILSQQALQDWEGKREERMKKYNKQRS